MGAGLSSCFEAPTSPFGVFSKKMKGIKMTSTSHIDTDLIIGNITISSKNQLYRLNDLHKAAGGLSKDKPSDWLTLDSTKELIAFLEEDLMTVEASSKNTDAVKPEAKQNQILTVIKNGGKIPQGTYACKELVYSYAMWISPKFHIAVIRAYDELVNHSYQHDAALEKFRKAMLLEKPSEWQKLYTEDFYKPVMRLFGWKFESNKGGLPAVVGFITREWIYQVVVPKEILEEIDAKCESEKIHQWFNEEGGRQKLLNQITMVAGIAKTCRTYNEFKIKAGCVFNDSPLQLEMF